MGFLETASDVVSNTWDWLGDADNLKTAGTIGGAVATGISSYKQSQAAEDILKMQKDFYAREIAKDDARQDSIDNAFNTVYGTDKKKKTTTASMDLGV